MKVTKLTPAAVAEVFSIDLSKPVPPEQFAKIRGEFLDHSLPLFRRQQLTPVQLVAFSEQWGPPESYNTIHRPHQQGAVRARRATARRPSMLYRAHVRLIFWSTGDGAGGGEPLRVPRIEQVRLHDRRDLYCQRRINLQAFDCLNAAS